MKNLGAVESHLPIFKRLFTTFDIKSVFEYGIGIFSTSIFIDNCPRVLSIEMNTHSLNGQLWYDKVIEDMGEQENWEHHNMVGEFPAIAYALKLFNTEKFDLVFADGHGESRGEQTNSGFGVARFVVTHDAQHSATRNSWRVPPEYTQIDFINYCQSYNTDGDTWPVTTVFCADSEDAKVVQEWLSNEKEVCKEYVDYNENK